MIGDGGRHRGNTNTSSQLRTIITLRWNTYTFRYDLASPLATRQREVHHGSRRDMASCMHAAYPPFHGNAVPCVFASREHNK